MFNARCSLLYLDVEIGLVVNTATVREGGTIPVTVRVINGDLSVPVEVSLSTLSRTAIGM